MENANTLFIIEMVAVALFALAGLAVQFHAWPHPLFLLVWTGVIFVGFSLYRGVAYARRRFTPAPAVGASDGGAPAAEASEPPAAARSWAAVQASEIDPTLIHPAARVVDPRRNIPGLGAAFEAEELRRETELDLVEPEAGPLPAFAESTLSVEQREQTLRTLLKDIGELKDPRESADPADDATLLQPVDALPPEDSSKKNARKSADPANDATLLQPASALPPKGSSKKNPRKSADPDPPSEAEDEDMRATLRAPLKALEQKTPQHKARPQTKPNPPTPRSQQIGRRAQFLDSDALNALKLRAASLKPHAPDTDKNDSSDHEDPK